METILKDKTVVLGVSGGIAAYKSAELLRLMIKAGARCRVIMTRNACRFVGAVTFEALSGMPVFSDLFEGRDASIRHIDWAQNADAVVVAPATANIIGKLANGIADDALSTFMMAVTCPVLVCPSMNTHMYKSPALQRNLKTLSMSGCMVVEPGAGSLACGTVGPGRLPEPVEILDRLVCRLNAQDYAGKRVLITAGPTQEPIDPVRYISNPSSGKMGYALARAAEHRGAVVTLVSGPTALPEPLGGVDTVRVRTAAEMAAAVLERLERQDIIIKTAAVSDYTPTETSVHKIKKQNRAMTISLEPTRDILGEIGARKEARILVGFAAETRDLDENASSKLKRKNLDMIVANLIGPIESGFSSDTNRVTLIYKDGEKEAVPLMEKGRLAHLILDRILSRIQPR